MKRHEAWILRLSSQFQRRSHRSSLRVETKFINSLRVRRVRAGVGPHEHRVLRGLASADSAYNRFVRRSVEIENRGGDQESNTFFHNLSRSREILEISADGLVTCVVAKNFRIGLRPPARASFRIYFRPPVPMFRKSFFPPALPTHQNFGPAFVAVFYGLLRII